MTLQLDSDCASSEQAIRRPVSKMGVPPSMAKFGPLAMAVLYHEQNKIITPGAPPAPPARDGRMWSSVFLLAVGMLMGFAATWVALRYMA